MREFIAPQEQSHFFGKEGVVPFIGVVEDVNDPKHSNRVKVRCLGWHPEEKKGKDSITTDQLPWARVGMPTTGAQQARLGATHGLQPGSWVFGFFLDGYDGQDPFICNTFNFTCRSDKENNRTINNNKGKASEDETGFVKTSLGNENHPNAGDTIVSEQGKNYGAEGDKSGDNPATDADDPCTGEPSNRSKASEQRMYQPLKKGTLGNNSAQKYNVTKADGLCGSIAHAKDDVQKKISEMVPSAAARFIYGDAVWNTFTGNYMSMNGILAALGMEICNLLKQAVQSSKAAQEEVNRGALAIGIAAATTRDGVPAEAVAKTMTTKDDLFHGLFAVGFIDILCQLIIALLQQMLSEGNQGDGDNRGGETGATPGTSVKNPDASCIAERLIKNVEVLTDRAIIKAMEDAESSESTDVLGAVASILGALMSVMQFPLMQKYSTHPDVMNAAGTMSQDILTKTIGCNPMRDYNTLMGALGSVMGGSGGGGGGGQGSSGAKTGLENYPEIGFGGTSGPPADSINTRVCKDARTEVVPNPGTGLIEPPTTILVPIPDDGDEDDNVGGPTTPPGFIEIPVITYPPGDGGIVIPITLPSDEPKCADNFRKGIPNNIVIVEPGKKYYYSNKDKRKVFPSVYIPGYKGKPKPVIDRKTGELVAILTKCKDWTDPKSPITIIPDDNTGGIITEDPDWDINLGGFFIQNTGFDYCDPIIEVYDRDRKVLAAEVKLKTLHGRIVDYDIINNGSGFLRLPEVRIIDTGKPCGTDGGYGAKLFPIMNVIPKPDSKAALEETVMQYIFCPAKDMENILKPLTVDDIVTL